MAGADRDEAAGAVYAARNLFAKGDHVAAVTVLKQFVAAMPAGWKAIRESADEAAIAFWNFGEFMAYVAWRQGKGTGKNVIWVKPSYSEAYFALSYIFNEKRNLEEAAKATDIGLALEPDHPRLLCEKALTMQYMGRHAEAYELYEKASKCRPWAPMTQTAKALRGMGVSLIDLRRLDEAKTCLNKSLEYEPNNQVALDELTYIKHLREGAKSAPLRMWHAQPKNRT